MKTFLLFLFLFPSLCFSLEIRFKGLSKKVVSDVKKNVPKINSGKAGLDTVDDIIRRLMSSENYQGVEAHWLKVGEIVEIRAQRVKRVGEIILEGVESVSETDLLNLTSITPGEIFERPKFIEYANSLKEFYTKAGFPNSKVEIGFDPQENGSVNIKAIITENQPSIVEKVIFETENEGLSEKLKTFTKPYLDKVLSEEQLLKMKSQLAEYLANNRFLRSQISEPKITYTEGDIKATLKFTIKNPHRYEFLIAGNEAPQLTDQTIIRKLVDSSLRTSTKTPLDFSKTALKDLYLQFGFANAEVDGEEKTYENSFRKDISLEVKEGFRIRIKELNILGRFSRPEKYYSSFIREHSSSLVSSGFLNKLDLEKGAKNLITELRNQGYIKAKVQSIQIKALDEKNARVEVNLQEGPLTQIRRIEFSGNKSFTKLQLTELLDIQSNSPLELEKLESSIKKIKSFYLKKGFLEMVLLNEEKGLVNYNSNNTEAQIRFNISEGPQIIVGRVQVRGYKRTKKHVILRELEFKKGDILTPEVIRDSQLRLERLGVFGRVQIDTLEKDSNISRRTVLISVTEKKPHVFRFGAGVTNERALTIRGYIGYGINNIAGTAQSINSRVELNNNIGDIDFLEKKATIRYLVPSFWGSRWRLRTNVAFSQGILEIIEATKEATILEKVDLDLIFERELTDHTTFKWTAWSRSLQKTFDKDNTSDNEVRSIAKIGPTLELDYRDDPFNPEKGHFTRLRFDYSDPAFGSSSSIKFHKTTARFSHYLPVGKLVWANSIRGGYIKSLLSAQSATDGVPAVEAFFLGSRSTIRGFDVNNERFPTNAELGVNSIDDFFLKDESYFGLVKSEIRFPIFGSLGGAIFYDGGIVHVTGFDFRDPYRDSVGVGLRIITPVGPVNFELGYKLDRKKDLGEEPLRFHFSIGSF